MRLCFQHTLMYSHNYLRLFAVYKRFDNFNLSVVKNSRLIIQPVRHRFFGTTMPSEKNKVAVILSGSGVYDGSEIHEAAACFAALTRHGATPIAYSLDKDQYHVVAHNTGQGLYYLK